MRRCNVFTRDCHRLRRPLPGNLPHPVESDPTSADENLVPDPPAWARQPVRCTRDRWHAENSTYSGQVGIEDMAHGNTTGPERVSG